MIVSGPGAYQAPPALGKQVLSTKASSGMPFMVQSQRPALYSTSTSDIGPGEYGVAPAACEPQLDSRKKTTATVKFGTGYHKGNKQHNMKIDLSEPQPGPGSYVMPGGIGETSMVYRSAPKASLSGRHSFGSPWPTKS